MVGPTAGLKDEMKLLIFILELAFSIFSLQWIIPEY